MRLLVTGAAGMLGRAVREALQENHEVVAVDLADFDLALENSIPKMVETEPDTICHLAAFTDVDGCESDPERAYHSNVVATRNVALACKKAGCSMLYVSTDYVFNGESRVPYDVGDRANPLNMYGRTKLIGEWFVERIVENCCIVRSSWLFGEGGKNFVEAVLYRAEKGEALKVVDDQVGSPTYTKDLASALGILIREGAFGVYHVTNSGQCTWFEFAVRVLETARVSGCVVNRTVSSELGRAARRPAYSVLDNRVYDRKTKTPLRPWEEALKDYVERRNGG